MCTRVCRVYTCIYARACVCGEVWWLLGCLPRLSGALPARTLNPARLNLGIIRGYNQPSLPSPPHPPPHRLLLATLPPPPPPPPPSLPCLREKMRAREYTYTRSLSLSVSRALSAELAVTSSFFLRPSSPDISRSAKGVEPPHLPRRENILQGPSYPPAQGSPLLQLLLRTHGKHFCR